MIRRESVDALHDRSIEMQEGLHKAQHVLLGAWNLLDDIDASRCLPFPLSAQVATVMAEIGVLLEGRWAADPHAFTRQELPGISTGFAPDIA